MALRLSLLVLLCLLFTFLTVAGQSYLPIYLGLGYDLLQGNPLSDHVDPGFMHPLFKWTYKQSKTIDNGRYFIPDQVGSTSLSVCNFQSEFSNYTGGQSYQNALNNKISVGAGYKGRINQASFTFSDNFQNMEKNTLDENRVVTHTTAECQAYRLNYNPSDSRDMSPNFLNGILTSYKNDDWFKFIDQFGTCYVSEVLMGGRATEEITYDSKAVSRMNAANMSIEVAAQAKFRKFYATGDYNSSNNQQASAYAESFSSSIRQFNIGGEPLRDGNASNWWLKVLENPMPIRIKIDWISELFDIITNVSGFNATQAKKQFNRALDDYCTAVECQAAKANKGLPTKATVQRMITLLLKCQGNKCARQEKLLSCRHYLKSIFSIIFFKKNM